MEITKKDERLYREDYEGRIQEILQLVTHRFHIVTSAVLVFAAISGWLTAFIASNHGIEDDSLKQTAATVSLLLLVLLGLLYVMYFSLYKVLRIYSAYLLVVNPDGWERDWKHWKQYRIYDKRVGYWGYSKPSGLIFLVLGVVSFAYPQMLLFFLRDIGFKLAVFDVVNFSLLCALLGYVIHTTWWTKGWIDEDRLELDWKTVLNVK